MGSDDTPGSGQCPASPPPPWDHTYQVQIPGDGTWNDGLVLGSGCYLIFTLYYILYNQNGECGIFLMNIKKRCFY